MKVSIEEIECVKDKVAPRFELGVEALQAPALPLGYATLVENLYLSFLQDKRQILFLPDFSRIR